MKPFAAVAKFPTDGCSVRPGRGRVPTRPPGRFRQTAPNDAEPLPFAVHTIGNWRVSLSKTKRELTPARQPARL